MIQFSSQDTYLNGTIAQVHHLLEITSCEGRRSIWFMQQRMVQGRSWRVFERIASRSSSAFNINRCVHKFGGLFSVKFVGIIDVIICIYFAPFPLNIYIPGSGKLLKRKWRQQHMCRVLIKVYSHHPARLDPSHQPITTAFSFVRCSAASGVEMKIRTGWNGWTFHPYLRTSQ